MSAIPWKFPRTGVAAVDRILSEIADRVKRRFEEVDSDLSGKSASTHTHDDRYYTETETDTLLSGKQDQDGALDDIAGLSPSTGDMLYWNGTHWVLIAAAGANAGDVLTFDGTKGVWQALP